MNRKQRRHGPIPRTVPKPGSGSATIMALVEGCCTDQEIADHLKITRQHARATRMYWERKKP